MLETTSSLILSTAIWPVHTMDLDREGTRGGNDLALARLTWAGPNPMDTDMGRKAARYEQGR